MESPKDAKLCVVEEQAHIRRGMRGGRGGRGEGREWEENGQETKKDRVGVKRVCMTQRSQLLGSLVLHPEPELSTMPGNSSCPQTLGCLRLLCP